jgi:hypothetical protein
VERFEFARLPGRSWLAGIWAGEVLFLIVLAAYAAGLLAATASRPPAGKAALGVGTLAGVVVGLVMYAMPPLASRLHVETAWLAWAYSVARVLAVPVALGAAIAAGLVAARRTSRRDSALPLADARARQGFAAGLCAGVAGALVVSVVGIATIALEHGEARRLQWTLPVQHRLAGALDTVYSFEVGVSHAAAGYLVVLLFFPLIGAGLGAWGGLYAGGRPGHRPDGGGGGGRGPRSPLLDPPAPAGGRRPGDEGQPAAPDAAWLLSLPDWQVPSGDEAGEPSPDRERVPAGLAC